MWLNCKWFQWVAILKSTQLDMILFDVSCWTLPFVVFTRQPDYIVMT